MPSAVPRSTFRRLAGNILRKLGLYAAANALLDRWDAWRRPARRLPFFRALVRPGDLCFDVGANFGEYTEFFLLLGARVVAVEPMDPCLKVLDEKFANRPDVTLVRKGLAAAEGAQTIHFSDQATDVSSMADDWIESVRKSPRLANPAYHWNQSKSVPVTTLDRLIEQHGMPAFCKIDVEGYELQVLAGLSRPLPCLSLEYTPECLEKTFACIHRLREIGDYEFNLSTGLSYRFVFPRWLPAASAAETLKQLRLTSHGDIYARLRRH